MPRLTDDIAKEIEKALPEIVPGEHEDLHWDLAIGQTPQGIMLLAVFWGQGVIVGDLIEEHYIISNPGAMSTEDVKTLCRKAYEDLQADRSAQLADAQGHAAQGNGGNVLHLPGSPEPPS